LEQELKNAAGQASGEAPLAKEELNKVAGGLCRAGGDKLKYM
jgi:hypothetical protein